MTGSTMCPQDIQRHPFIHIEIPLSLISIKLSITMRPSHLVHCMEPSSDPTEPKTSTGSPSCLLQLKESNCGATCFVARACVFLRGIVEWRQIQFALNRLYLWHIDPMRQKRRGLRAKALREKIPSLTAKLHRSLQRLRPIGSKLCH